MEADFANRRDNEDARPPRTWNAQRDRGPQRAGNDDKSYTVAASLEDLTKSKEAAIRFQPVAKEAREQYSQRGQEFRKTREERQKLEVAAVEGSAEAPVRTAKPVKVKLPRTPITSQPVDRLEKDYVPPQAIEAPGPDLKVEPKPRKPRVNATAPVVRNPEKPPASLAPSGRRGRRREPRESRGKPSRFTQPSETRFPGPSRSPIRPGRK